MVYTPYDVYLFDNLEETIEGVEDISFGKSLFAAAYVTYLTPGIWFFHGGMGNTWYTSDMYATNIFTMAPTPSPIYLMNSNLTTLSLGTRYFYGTADNSLQGEVIECALNKTDTCFVECVGDLACFQSTVICPSYYCGVRCLGNFFCSRFPHTN